MGEYESLKDIPKESSNIKSYEKSINANKISEIHIQNLNNETVGYPEGIGKKNKLPSHVFHGSDNHTHALETEEQKAGATVKPKTGTGSEGLVKPNTGTPSNSHNINNVSPSLTEEDKSVPNGWKPNIIEIAKELIEELKSRWKRTKIGVEEVLDRVDGWADAELQLHLL